MPIREAAKIIRLDLSTNDPADMPELYKRITATIEQVAKGDTFSISIILSIHREKEDVGTKKADSVQKLLRELFINLSHHYSLTKGGRGSIRRAARELRITRSTLYSWLSGTPMSVPSARNLVDLMPTEQLRVKAAAILDVVLTTKS